MILFLDDEEQADLFLEALQDAHLPVRAFRSVGPALEFVNGYQGPLHIAVVDVMMPPGDSFSQEETSGGLLTGLCVLERIRTRYSSCIVYLLTNMASSRLLDRVANDPNTRIRIKTDIFYDEFAEEVREGFERLGEKREKGAF